MTLTDQELNAIANKISNAVDEYCNKKWINENRSHLGCSLIGHECKRHLWYGFRWCKTPNHKPRLKRLFDRGHREEERFIDYLRGIGCTIEPFDSKFRLFYNKRNDPIYRIDVLENQKEGFDLDVSTNSWYIEDARKQGLDYPVQHRVSDVHGHFGGSLDGIGYLPPEFGIDEQILFEFKTSNTKNYDKLVKNGMFYEKPQHYAQCCTYGFLKKLNYVLYCAVNKETDDLYFELVALNHNTGNVMVEKAKEIITIQEPPPRLHNDPTYLICKFCDNFDICHQNAPIERNCRSCVNAFPAENGDWFCKVHNCNIPKSELGKYFNCWKSILENNT